MRYTAGLTIQPKYLQSRQLRVNSQFLIHSQSMNQLTRTTSNYWCIDARSFSKSNRKHRRSWHSWSDFNMTQHSKINQMMKKRGTGANSPAWFIDLNKNIMSTISSTLMAMTWERLLSLRKISLVILKFQMSSRSRHLAKRRSGLHQPATLSESLASRMIANQRRRYLRLMIVYSRSWRSPSALVARKITLLRAYLATTIRTIAGTWMLSKLTMRKSNIKDAL